MSWKLYVIHFDKPYKHAKHYTGIAIDVDKRIKEHKGGYGSKLMAVITKNNIGFKCNIIGEYPTYSIAKAEEKRLKTKVKQPKKYCPICIENKNCKHERIIGDNYGETCADCNEILFGYGCGGWFGNNLIKGRKCKHKFIKFEDEEGCMYCERIKENAIR